MIRRRRQSLKKKDVYPTKLHLIQEQRASGGESLQLSAHCEYESLSERWIVCEVPRAEEHGSRGRWQQRKFTAEEGQQRKITAEEDHSRGRSQQRKITPEEDHYLSRKVNGLEY